MAIGSTLPETPLVLDTDSLTHWRNAHIYIEREISDYIRRHKKPPSLTSMTVFEALFGIENSLVKNAISEEAAKGYSDRMGRLIAASVVLPFDQNSAAIAAYIFPRLSKAERNAHWRDLFIAATALAYGHGVVTQNKKDFEIIASHLPSNYPLLRLAIWKP